MTAAPERGDVANAPQTERPRLKTRDYLGYAIKLLVAALLLGVAIYSVDFAASADILAKAEIVPLLAALVAATVGTIVLPAFITHRSLHGEKISLSAMELVSINFSVRFYVIVLPRAASVAIRWFRYGKGKFSADSLALMLFERVVQFAAMLFLCLVAVCIDFARLGEFAWPLVLLCLGGTLFGLAMLLPFMSAKAERLAAHLLVRFSPWMPARIVRAMTTLIASVGAYRHLPGNRALPIIVMSLLATFLFVLSAWYCAHAIGLDISLVSLIWVRSLVFLLTLMPISVAGVGLRELGFVGLLGLIGVPAPAALAFSLANFSLQLVQAAVGGIIEAARFLCRFSTTQAALIQRSIAS